MTKAPPFEFDLDKYDIPLFLISFRGISFLTSLKLLLLSCDSFEPITTQNFSTIFDFWQENSDHTWRRQFLVPLPPFHPVFNIVVYG